MPKKIKSFVASVISLILPTTLLSSSCVTNISNKINNFKNLNKDNKNTQNHEGSNPSTPPKKTIPLTPIQNPPKKSIPPIDKTIENTLNFIGDKPFYNINSTTNIEDQKTTFKTYIHKKTNDVYINLNEVIEKIGFLFNGNKIQYKKNSITKKIADIDLGNNNELFKFDEETNEIIFTSSSAFKLNPSNFQWFKYNDIRYNETKFLRTKNKYNEHNKLKLGDYQMEIIIDNQQIYLPFWAFNLMFISNQYYNIQFNGKSFIGLNYQTSRQVVAGRHNLDQDFLNTMDAYYNNSLELKYSRINNLNYLAFLFDNYFGLAQNLYKSKKVKNFYGLVESYNLKNRLLSTSESEYVSAYDELWNNILNDPHSRIISKSYGWKYWDAHRSHSISKKNKEMLDNRQKLIDARFEAKNPENQNHNLLNKITHVYKDTARIVLDNFEDIAALSDSGIEKWKYNSFERMKAAMERIKKDDPNNQVKNIILDLSLNGGGSSLELQKTLGFINNKDISLIIHDKLSSEYTHLNYNVDTNNDNLYNEKDGFSEYKWYVLVGVNTFSAANLFAHVVKQENIATVIGQKTGGGMFSVLPTILPDGTNVDISSTLAWTGKPNREVHTSEDLPFTDQGIEPDFYVDYKNFTKHDILNYLIKKENNG
ncbi:peptidase [Mycoplasmopsis bovigenitalium]|uniref:S41 family peptidase n=1 Tax=Mycoplasmopsis bovigenitalium TaxID=2112 RepID=UPI00090A5351|nr:S41 family peptidase [Mycoplasmopsis bovigenitalium]BAW18301.1 peptidase [Mycoplasmopsis bovigenitalium]